MDDVFDDFERFMAGWLSLRAVCRFDGLLGDGLVFDVLVENYCFFGIRL